MPTYEYKCEACGHAFEKFQSIKAPAVRKCPVCGKPKVRRLVSVGAGMIFKGSGFYSTDYRSESYKSGEKSESAAAPGAASAADTKPGGAKAAQADATAKSDSAAKSEPSRAAAPVAKTDAPSATGKPAAGSRKSSRATD
jgi:putative FmdB family regulatory protein